MRRWLIPALVILFVIADWGVLWLLYNAIGLAWTTLLVLLFIPVGLYLQFSQGAAIKDQLMQAFRSGQHLPETAMAGALVLLGGALMVLPGVLSSLLGLVLVAPITRKYFSPLLVKAIATRLPDPGVGAAGLFGNGVIVGSTGTQGTPRSGGPSGRASRDVVDANPTGSRRPSGNKTQHGTPQQPSSGRKSLSAEVVNIERNQPGNGPSR